MVGNFGSQLQQQLQQKQQVQERLTRTQRLRERLQSQPRYTTTTRTISVEEQIKENLIEYDKRIEEKRKELENLKAKYEQDRRRGEISQAQKDRIHKREIYLENLENNRNKIEEGYELGGVLSYVRDSSSAQFESREENKQFQRDVQAGKYDLKKVRISNREVVNKTQYNRAVGEYNKNVAYQNQLVSYAGQQGYENLTKDLQEEMKKRGLVTETTTTIDITKQEWEKQGLKPVVNAQGDITGFEDIKAKKSIPLQNMPEERLAQLQTAGLLGEITYTTEEKPNEDKRNWLKKLLNLEESYSILGKFKEKLNTKDNKFLGLTLWRDEPVATETQEQIASNKNYPLIMRAVNYPFGQLNILGQKYISPQLQRLQTEPQSDFIKAMDKFNIVNSRASAKIVDTLVVSQLGTLAEFGFYEPLFSKPAFETKTILEKTKAKEKITGEEFIKYSEKTGKAEGFYLIKKTTSPRYVKITTELEKALNIKPSIEMIAKERIDFSFTPSLKPKEVKVLKIGKESLQSPIITKMGFIEQHSGIFVQRGGAKTGKLISLEGYQKNIGLQDIWSEMNAGQRNILKQIAKEKTGGIPVSEKFVPKILGKKYDYSYGVLRGELKGKFKMNAKEMIITPRLSNIPKKIQISENIAVIKEASKAEKNALFNALERRIAFKNLENYDVYKTMTGLRDITFPLSRTQKVPKIRTLSIVKNIDKDIGDIGEDIVLKSMRTSDKSFGWAETKTSKEALKSILKEKTEPSLKLGLNKGVTNVLQQMKTAEIIGVKSMARQRTTPVELIKSETKLASASILMNELKSEQKTSQKLDLKNLLKSQLKYELKTNQKLDMKTQLKLQQKLMQKLMQKTITKPIITTGLNFIRIPRTTYKPFVLPMGLKGKIKAKARYRKFPEIFGSLPDFTAIVTEINPREVSLKQALKEMKQIKTGFEIRRGLRLKNYTPIDEKSLLRGIMQ